MRDERERRLAVGLGGAVLRRLGGAWGTQYRATVCTVAERMDGRCEHRLGGGRSRWSRHSWRGLRSGCVEPNGEVRKVANHSEAHVTAVVNVKRPA